MQTTYSGQLVRIRPFASLAELSDFARAQFIVTSPFWGVDWHRATGSAARWQRGAEDLDMRFAVERLDTGELAGWLSARPQDLQLAGSVGTEIAPRHQSRGFGREAKLLAMCWPFENFPIESVWADTLATHRRARAGLEAIGLRLVGTRRRAVYSQGQWADRVYYQIMREEWEELPIRRIIRRF